MACWSETGMATSSRALETASAAARMPAPSAVGLAPAATLRMPSCTRAWASTVAVVVPSPATSLVLVATFLASWAPRFSYGSSSSTSRAMVTPSLVMVGAPNFLSRTTLRPRGPSVTLTASASLSTPRSSARRASSLNLMILAMGPFRSGGARGGTTTAPGPGQDGSPGRSGDVLERPRPEARPERARDEEDEVLLLLHDGEQVAGGEHEVLLAGVLDLGAAVLRVDDDVADVDVERDAVAVVVDAAGAHGDDRALLRLLLGGVRDDQAGGGGRLGLVGLDHDTVLERLDGDLGSGRHEVTPPSGSDGGWTARCGPGSWAAVAGVRRGPVSIGTLPRRVPAAQPGHRGGGTGPAGGWCG